jgi:hypothetical protein
MSVPWANIGGLFGGIVVLVAMHRIGLLPKEVAIALAVVFSIYMLYYTIAYWVLPKKVNQIGADEVNISTIAQVVNSEDLNTAWNSTSGSTLVFSIFPDIIDRTSVSGNEYATVIQIGSKQSFNMLVAPDAGRGYSTAPAVLEIYEKGVTDSTIVEIPNIPLQRWTHVAIVKNGRKFNIYINGKLTVSHMCTAMPDFDSTQPLRVGTPRMKGTIAMMMLASYPMQTNEIRDLYSSTTASDGSPNTIGKIPILPNFNINSLTSYFTFCPGGNCENPGSPGPMESWSSPYA